MTDTAPELASPLVTYDVAPRESLSEGVVAALATALDAEPTPDADTDADDVLDPLYSVIDPEPLDALFGPDGATGRVIFTYDDYEVVAHSDGRVTVDPIDATSTLSAD